MYTSQYHTFFPFLQSFQYQSQTFPRSQPIYNNNNEMYHQQAANKNLTSLSMVESIRTRRTVIVINSKNPMHFNVYRIIILRWLFFSEHISIKIKFAIIYRHTSIAYQRRLKFISSHIHLF